MSTTQKAADLWALDIRVWRDGKEYRTREEYRGGRKAAEARAFEIRKKLKARAVEGGSLKVTAYTFADALTFYLDRHEIGPSKSLFNRLAADLGAVNLSELGARFDRWLLLIRQSKAQRTGRPIAPGTVNRYLAWSRAALNFAVRNRLIDRNPIAHIEPLKEIARDVSLSPGDELRLLNMIEAEAPHLSAAVRFMLQVPCRISEVVNAKRGDVDLFNNCVRIRNGKTKTGDGVDKPIPPGLVAYMREIPAESEYVFYRVVNGRYFGLGSIKRSWRRCCRLAGLPGLRVHDLRHVAASRLIDNGTPEEIVSQIAGWRPGSRMLRTYYHRSPKKALELVRFEPETGHLTVHRTAFSE